MCLCFSFNFQHAGRLSISLKDQAEHFHLRIILETTATTETAHGDLELTQVFFNFDEAYGIEQTWPTSDLAPKATVLRCRHRHTPRGGGGVRGWHGSAEWHIRGQWHFLGGVAYFMGVGTSIGVAHFKGMTFFPGGLTLVLT